MKKRTSHHGIPEKVKDKVESNRNLSQGITMRLIEKYKPGDRYNKHRAVNGINQKIVGLNYE